MEIRNKVIKTIEDVFKLFGYYSWDGPCFEYMETLTRKSGEGIESEIYTFKDKGNRNLGLRFELTATIARIIANNSNLKKPIKGYSVGKVWRYENTQQGRYREFLQMDADVFGSDNVICEVELLDMARRILDSVGFKNYYIQLNNRKIIEGIVRYCGISNDKKADVLRAVDKLNKIGNEGVKKEFINRGLTETQFEDVMKFINIGGTNEERLNKMSELLKEDAIGIEGLNEVRKILEYSKDILLDSKILVDYSLIRGLDYYTGSIYEIKISQGEHVGSISGGGRYDTLVGLFGGNNTPAVGISFGIERIIDLIANDAELSIKYKATAPDILVIYLNTELVNHAYKIATQMRNCGISADVDLAMRSLKKQLQYASEKGYQYVIFVGEDEIQKNRYMLKNMNTQEEVSLNIDDIINKLKKY